MSESSPWRPLLSGALAEAARAAFAEIAADLARLSPADGAREMPELALFFAYADRAEPGAGHDDRAAEWLDRAIDSLATRPMSPALHGGFTGVAWVAEHLDPAADDELDPNAGIDEALLAALAPDRWRHGYDLVSGLAGLMIYALERLPRPSARLLLDRALDRLEERAERGALGVTWHTSPGLLPDWQRELAPRGYYNLGVAHGVPGLIAALARALPAGGAIASRARALLDGAVAWLLAQRCAGDDAAFANWIAEGQADALARSAWCYGDPGIAAALMLAARHTGDDAWRAAAHQLARGVACRDPERAAAHDAGLCHGAAGLAHLLNRLYQATGDGELRDAAVRWLERALGHRRPGQGIGGFLSYKPGPTGEPGWHADPGLLTGAAGAGLVFLAATTEIEPGWDRLLGCAG